MAALMGQQVLMMKLSPKGFTLLELMVAAGILVIIISGLLVLFIHCLFLNESNNNLVTAFNDAQYVLEEIRDLAYNAIDDYNPPTLTNLKNETISLVRDIETMIAEVSVNVSWTERQGNREISLSTQIARTTQ